MFEAIIDDLNRLREYYLINGQTEAAQGVLSAIAVVEDYRVDKWGTLSQWQPTGAPLDWIHSYPTSRKESNG